MLPSRVAVSRGYLHNIVYVKKIRSTKFVDIDNCFYNISYYKIL